MTLILTVANVLGICQSSDFQLTHPTTGALVSDSAGSIQLQASFSDLHLQVAFTGVAADSRGNRTIDWLTTALADLPHDAAAERVFETLQKVSAQKMAPLGPKGVLMLVLGIAEFGKPFRIAQITNASLDRRKGTLVAKPRFDIRVRTITKPFHLISGLPCVSAQDDYRLTALSKADGKSPQEMRDELAAINSRAAQNSGGGVSEGCWITVQTADGKNRRFGEFYVGDSTGQVPTLFYGMDIEKLIREKFNLPPGVRMTPIGGVYGEGTPLPPPEGAPHSFKLSTSTAKAFLRSESGEICASIEVTGGDYTVVARRNEQVTVPFGEFRLTGLTSDHADFPKPLLPWPTLSPTLSLDDSVVGEKCPYSIGYWIENGMHRVQILQSSSTLRDVSFLGTNDQLVLGFPVSGAEFSWSVSEPAPTATFQASVVWQARTR